MMRPGGGNFRMWSSASPTVQSGSREVKSPRTWAGTGSFNWASVRWSGIRTLYGRPAHGPQGGAGESPPVARGRCSALPGVGPGEVAEVVAGVCQGHGGEPDRGAVVRGGGGVFVPRPRVGDPRDGFAGRDPLAQRDPPGDQPAAL